MKQAVIAIFDIGKTNKKLFLFNQQYQIVWEKTAQFAETTDEDGDPCEDLERLRSWLLESWAEAHQLPNFDVQALNFSTYGASFVGVDAHGTALTPLYNYLKPYPEALQTQFYAQYGGEEALAVETASPVLGSLNSGMQLYRLKYQKPVLFAQIAHFLHLPQYVSMLFTNQFCADITSVGCHTNLWDFTKNQYHNWVQSEGIAQKLPPMASHQSSVLCNETKIGAGLHDSSAALIPYLAQFETPFVLISTGTWSISLNPFNDLPLTFEELQQDCLCYLTYEGRAVKASRLFAGHQHEQKVSELAQAFNLDENFYQNIDYQAVYSQKHEQLYYDFMTELVAKQVSSTYLVLANTPVTQIFVDGGFSKNALYMHLMAAAYPQFEVYAASVAQATALGAALVMHQQWNNAVLPTNLVEFY